MPKKAKKRTVRVAKVTKVSKPGILRNQLFGLILVAIGLGALVVVIRYFVISLQVPTSVYQISTQQLIPGAQ